MPTDVIDANVRTDIGWFRRLAGSPANALAKVRQYIERGSWSSSTSRTRRRRGGKVLGRDEPDKETVDQALAYRTALARRPDWDHPILAAVVEVCGNTGYNWFDLQA